MQMLRRYAMQIYDMSLAALHLAVAQSMSRRRRLRTPPGTTSFSKSLRDQDYWTRH